MAKLVKVRCHEPIGVNCDARQPWSDVWLRFKAKPGRRVYEFAPTLVSRPSLREDLEMAKEKYLYKDEREDARRLGQVLNYFKAGGRFYIIERPTGEMLTIYTCREYIDRAEAEAMLSHFLSTLGYHKIKYKWFGTDFVFTPTLVC